MTYTTSNTANELLQAFQGLDADQQLALFYFIYKETGKSITPAAPAASTVSPEIAQGLFDQVAQLSQEEQLQLQRDLIAHKNTELTREYGALSDTTKLLFWYFLAEGMDSGSIIPMPSNYKLSNEAQQLFGKIQGLEFQQQITLFRDFVSPMGVDSTVS
ncbi:Orange carotenoid protein [Kovacikia minuta CCNUW1]|uniref:orange carotenoid protein N-terminal domain-containing protein n=1 Tax=Kovacikia minuta TaxID=2931930 RepID=UPI001CCEC850|nr:orange carotenoid protein N-terminal domain-containing protein [Kovacikia minuta]UBF24092.1 Orange carotenoid protein [Kovacikia minuta CCNUW1]